MTSSESLVHRLRDRAYAFKAKDPLLEQAANEIVWLRLTDEERAAVERAVAFCECTNAPLPTSDQIATLRSLLERTKEVSDE
jgi:hypothetical protein